MKYILIAILILPYLSNLAQDYYFTIKGIIIDEYQVPIPDVKITTHNKMYSYRTNSSGQFSLHFNYLEDLQITNLIKPLINLIVNYVI